MKGFCGAGIFGGLVLVGLGGCSGAARDASSNTAPVAQQVTVSAANLPAYINTTLKGSFRYADGDGDVENGTQKAWLRDGQPIEGADQDTYTATLQDSGKKLQFRVTPAAATGKSPGAAVLSPAITIENSPPRIADLVIGGSVSGQAYTRAELTASYGFQDLDEDGEDRSTYEWLHDGTPEPISIGGATKQAYTVTDADMGKVILVRVTPRDSKNSIGAIYTSPPVKVINKAPVASNVRVIGKNINQAGDTLSVTYIYTDHENNTEAGSQFRWLRDGVAIANATNLVYTLTLEDAGKTITAEVTPQAENAENSADPSQPVLSNPVTVATAKVELSVSAGLKQLLFSWYPVTNATYYRVSYNPDGVSGFVPLSVASSTLTTISYDWDIPVHNLNWPKAQFMLEACDANNICLQSASISALNVMLGTIGYFKASNTGTNDHFGTAVALSGDGNTLAVGAPGEDSASINDPLDGCALVSPVNCARESGAVYVYTRSGSTWVQQAYLKASNIGEFDNFGYSVALSADGNTLAVGADRENSDSTGINSTPNELASAAGAVYVYTRNGIAWSQQAYVKASNTTLNDHFGYSVALSADGNTLAVGANEEDSNSTTIDSVPNVLAPAAGAVYIYTRRGVIWTQQAYVKASNTEAYDRFGTSVALSADGNTLAVGSSNENSAAVGGNPLDDCGAASPANCATGSGAVYVYTRKVVTWSQLAYVKASNPGRDDQFGWSVALSADGNTLAVGADRENSDSTGINSTPNELASAAGAVYVYTRNGIAWTQQAYVKASNTGDLDNFGYSVALSADGNTLAVGALAEGSKSKGVTASTAKRTPSAGAGAVYVYSRTSITWSQHAYVKASNTELHDRFGNSVTLSADGNTLAVGAYLEDSLSTGINRSLDDTNVGTEAEAGAVYLY